MRSLTASARVHAPVHAGSRGPPKKPTTSPSRRGLSDLRSTRPSSGPSTRLAAIAEPSSSIDETASRTPPPSTPAASPGSNQPRRKPVRARDFRHPLDQQNTQLLRAIPGLSGVTKSLVTPVAEQMLVLEQISTSVLVGPKQLPHVHKLVLDAAEVLDIPPPQLYIRQSSQPNAYTLAISGREPVVVVHTALIELMSAAELQAVIAHEMGHLKCDHGVWLTVANLLTLGVEIAPLVPTFVVGKFIFIPVWAISCMTSCFLCTDNFRDNLMRWVRAAELSCDRAALLVAGDPKVVVSVLMKLSGGCPKLSGQLNVDAFLDQARRYVYILIRVFMGN
jgi:Zn-dependent protease with chaperone function